MSDKVNKNSLWVCDNLFAFVLLVMEFLPDSYVAP